MAATYSTGVMQAPPKVGNMLRGKLMLNPVEINKFQPSKNNPNPTKNGVNV